MKKMFTVILLAVLFTACQDVINIDTPTYKTTLVIEGRITDSLGTRVRLSTSANYFDQGQTPAIDSAIVTLYENEIPVSVLQQSMSEPGIYTSTFNGTIGNSYFLEIEISNENTTGLENTTWRTSNQQLSRVFTFDSLKIKYLDRETFPPSFDEGNYVVGYFTEPAGIGDFYRLRYWKNDSLFTQNLRVLTDEFYDGFTFGSIRVPPLTIFGKMENPNDSASVEVSSISEDYYDYLSLLSQQVLQVGGPFSAPPALVQGNIYNVADPSEKGFGYFEASALSFSYIVYKP